ncbi:MAG TPA: type II secretion system protein [Longimicrobium sp.]|nr:type II secretion system protein [Longimicrobium sp.]
MSSTRPPRPSPRKPFLGRGGYTLVELVVALLIAGIFSIAMFNFLRNQTRFMAVESAQEEVNQNLRGALEVIASELRALPPAALLEGTDNSIQFLMPRAWGVACSSVGNIIVRAVFPQLPAGMVTTGVQNANVTSLIADQQLQQGALITDPAPATRPAPDWETGNGGARSQVASIANYAATGGDCAANGATPGTTQGYQFNGVNLPAVVRGKPVILATVVEYDAAESEDDGFVWVRRGNGQPGAQQPLAGPIPDDASLQFVYYNTTTGGPMAAPGNDATLLDDVRRIKVLLTTRSRSEAYGGVQTRQDSVTVYLRNQ